VLLVVCIILEVLAKAVRQGKEWKDISFKCKQVKLSLVAENLFLSNWIQKNLLDFLLLNQLSKVTKFAIFKINIQNIKISVLLYIAVNNLKMILTKQIFYNTARKNKILREVQVLHIENYKSLLTEF
jgi:hypothetical protein